MVFMPSGSADSGFLQSFITAVASVVLTVVELFTIILILWMLYKDEYKYLNVIEIALFISLLVSLITIYVFALINSSISFKYVLLNFALIIINILDFVVENITKVLKYNKSKSNNTKDT
ncbi:MAG: hypothetical protein IJW28_04555 [Clostridia bacterium]|nr:hypothetical protein [Clostridia bacterium]